jgi:PleD family two-component response regulator
VLNSIALFDLTACFFSIAPHVFPSWSLYGQVLVVNDSALVRKLMRRHLENVGYVVETVEHGRAALDLMMRKVQPLTS